MSMSRKCYTATKRTEKSVNQKFNKKTVSQPLKAYKITLEP